MYVPKTLRPVCSADISKKMLKKLLSTLNVKYLKYVLERLLFLSQNDWIEWSSKLTRPWMLCLCYFVVIDLKSGWQVEVSDQGDVRLWLQTESLSDAAELRLIFNDREITGTPVRTASVLQLRVGPFVIHPLPAITHPIQGCCHYTVMKTSWMEWFTRRVLGFYVLQRRLIVLSTWQRTLLVGLLLIKLTNACWPDLDLMEKSAHQVSQNHNLRKQCHQCMRGRFFSHWF